MGGGAVCFAGNLAGGTEWCSSVQYVGGVTSGWLFFGLLYEEIAVDVGGGFENRQRVGRDELIGFKKPVKRSNGELEEGDLESKGGGATNP